jgi:adenylate cyclase, class 2
MPVATEFEAKILNVDPVEVASRIVACGGRRVSGPVLLRRHVYDIAQGDDTRWMRLRSSGAGTTLAVKRIQHDRIGGTDEVEVEVGDFDVMNEILGWLGFTPKSYQENRRTSFELDGAEVEIDEWPLLAPYLEIEADSRETVILVAEKLGYDESLLTGRNTIDLYAEAGIDLNAYARLTFDLVPKGER